MKRTKPFMGIDGEGYTVDGEHRYVLLMNSDRDYISNPDGLSTIECFEYLLRQPRTHIYVAFGLNYDVNMILRDLGKQALKHLWVEGRLRWGPYTIEWIPGKWFSLCSDKYPKIIKINETFGFFQMSFVKALEKWNIQVQDSDELEEMKSARSIFDPAMRDRIIDYCHMECGLLVDLLQALRKALEDVDIHLSSWNGAGSIAARVLRREGVKDHHVPHTDLSQEVQSACLSSYFGGRTELFRQGHHTTVSQFDICSAYPFAALSLPSLQGGKWKHHKKYQPEAEHAIWEVEWNLPDNTRIAPFPYRRKGTICYPLNGRGWYHACEVQEAFRHHSQITVKHGYVFSQAPTAERPFAFITSIYAYRRALKAEGHAGEKCLKLGINSLYGKLAQGVGYRDSLPPFQNYFWAGEITARTRARLLQLLHHAPNQVIMVATDGIFYNGIVEHPVGSDLGDLEGNTLKEMFTAQPGVYSALTDDGTEIKRSRGFFAKEIDFPALLTGYNIDGCNHIGHYNSTRFVGAGTALMSKDLNGWRTWRESTRKLSLYPSTKTVKDSRARPILHLPPRLAEPDVPSEPYKPKMKGYADDQVDYTQGKEQPLRTD
jgi:hypothetical protein